MKRLKLLISSIIISTSLLFSSNVSVFAKTTAIDITGTDGKVYEYNYANLKASSVAYVLNGANDIGAKLYNDFMTRKVSVNAYYDDIKNAYIDAATVSNEAVNKTLKGQTFILDEFTSADTTKTTVITPNKVTFDNGNILIDGKEQSTSLVDMSSLTFDTTTVPYTTVISFKLNVSDPQNYIVKVENVEASFSTTGNKFGVSLNGKLSISDLTQSDFVITKKTDDISTPSVDMTSLVLDTTSISESTVLTFKLNVTNPQDYNVTVKGKTTTFSAISNYFGVALDGTLSANDFTISDFIITKKETPTLTVSKIDNINDTVLQNASYTLPTSIVATMSDGSYRTVKVIWDKQVDTSQLGTFTFNGTVSGYNHKVILTLNVQSKKSNVDESKIKIEKDDVLNYTWYKPISYLGSSIYLCIGQNSSNQIWLRQVFRYDREDYIYINKYVINVDGQVYTITPSTSDMHYKFYGNETIAIYDISPNLDLMKKIASSSKTIIRMQGYSESKDFVISQNEKDNITNILNKYNQMLGK